MNTSDVPPYSRRSQILVLFPQRSSFRPGACFGRFKECICLVLVIFLGGCWLLVIAIEGRRQKNCKPRPSK